MMMMMMMMGFGLIVPLILIGAVVLLVGWRPQFNQARQHQTSHAPVEMLKARYAEGEITREEYDQIRRDLEG